MNAILKLQIARAAYCVSHAIEAVQLLQTAITVTIILGFVSSYVEQVNIYPALCDAVKCH